ncbi:DUF5996 family protein [Methanolobus chelungpuianus]|nr:DUF5996 family protein [Methanolobus chelungpuianus]
MKDRNKEIWPELLFKEGKETYQTIHLWTQVVGKIKLAKMPWINHSWHVALMVTPVGLTTGDLPSDGKHFQIDFDFLNHQLEIKTSRNEVRRFDLPSLSVGAFYRDILDSLKEMNIEVKINPVPSEMESPVPLDKDERDSYVPEVATALHCALLQSNQVFTEFRAGFIGKCSPVHFFWGSFDLAVSRFSGRKAPLHPGGIPNFPDWVAIDAYSHEVSSCGFWPGNDAVPFAAFYSYIYPEPQGFKSAGIKPESAYYHNDLGEFILPYKEVQQSNDPSQTLLDFLNTTYEAAADSAHWDRENLERR